MLNILDISSDFDCWHRSKDRLYSLLPNIRLFFSLKNSAFRSTLKKENNKNQNNRNTLNKLPQNIKPASVN
ncbi:hypothetical protein [Edwardsiella hoshinae]|uniref:hypothetical protein n=1 Tax=Edwardsiella hoshinae TaxID=93378 RepID=UPI0012EA63A2|nr:hypothetical protein [Edwardsiella hoshinae]